jgi:hypothetical protein
VLADEGEEGLGSLLNGLVESLGRRVAVGAEDLVLGKEHALDTTHKDTTLTVKVRVDLLLEGGLVGVTGTDGDGDGASLLHGLAGHVLPDGDRGVDTTALLEEGADGAAGTLGGAEDDVDVLGGLNTGVLVEDEGETVGEVEGLALGLHVEKENQKTRFSKNDGKRERTMRGLMSFQVWDWAASERRFMMMVPLLIASLMGKRFLPGTYENGDACQYS